MFSKNAGVKYPNEAKVLAILEVLCVYCHSFQQNLIVECDSFNAVFWVKSFRGPWKMQVLLNEIKYLASLTQVSFQLVGRSCQWCSGYSSKARG